MLNVVCPSCNTPAVSGAIFCDNCGYDLRTVLQKGAQSPSDRDIAPEQTPVSLVCPSCGHANLPKSVFCENCGFQFPQKAPVKEPAQAPKLNEAESPAPPKPEPAADIYSGSSLSDIPKASLASIPGRLLNTNLNISIPIPSEKQSIFIGREDPVSGIFPDIDLDLHGGHEAGVGRRHAKLTLQNEVVYLEDLDSVNGTVVNKKKLMPHEPFIIKNGDELRFGKLVLIYISE